MDSIFLIMLALVDKPLTAEEIIKKMVDEMGKSSPYKHVESNDFGADLNDLYRAGDFINKEGDKFCVTDNGRKMLSESKVIRFIQGQAGKI